MNNDQPTDYYAQQDLNEYKFKELLKIIRPDIWLLMENLDTTGVNYLILLKAIQQLDRIARGSKFGTVTVEIQNGVCTFVRGEESSRLNEDVLKITTTP